MGTRSLTTVMEDGQPLLTLYAQFDGYPSGMGEALKDFAGKMKVCNGFSEEKKAGEWANGMGCFAAQLVAHFKKEIGNFYIKPAGSKDHWEDYLYVLSNVNNRIHLAVFDPVKQLYDGPLADFDAKKVEEAMNAD